MAEFTKEEIYERYNHDDIPKAKNPLWNNYFCFLKVFGFGFFFLGAIVLACVVFPIIRLFSLRKDFGITARAYVSHTFRWFLRFVDFSGIAHQNVPNKDEFKKLQSKIIVANHPSIMDFPLIMSLSPKSTCIVGSSYVKTPLGGVIKQAYITNNTDFDQLLIECKKLTDKGCNVIIFPEGTRTPRHGKNIYKKGAARIALYCGCDVQPVFIGGSDKYGLGKHDPVWSYNHVENLYYDLKLLEPISVSKYKDLTGPIAAKHLTEDIESTIKKASREYELNHTCKTLNNV